MAWFGLALLAMIALGLVFTGLPAFVVLILVSIVGAGVGSLVPSVAVDLLNALPGRIVGLLENDLLQALPLFVLMGALLDRLRVIDSLYSTSVALFGRRSAGPLVSGMALGAVMGPMNGSVGASVMALSRVLAPRLSVSGVAPPSRHAAIAVASTFGVVIPPSLVLILLGDAMLYAHTVALNATGRRDRIINTQDVFHGALVPGLAFVALCLVVAWWIGHRAATHVRSGAATTSSPVSWKSAALAAATLGPLIALLAGVALGYFYAVEAAAMGAFALLVVGVATGRLRGGTLSRLLHEVMATAGALFALLIGATTLTLVLRVYGTDALVSDWITGMPGGERSAVAAVLGAIGLSAFVLDAFEIIFVIVPIVIPPLLVRTPDAVWVAVLVLLALQASFLLPPFGYALMMARSAMKEVVPLAAVLRSLAPFLAVQVLVLIAVFVFPALVHLGGYSGL
ncbi:MAG TPA: TRAP transporter large permease subunit [Casimicrobiaceae bacterium]|nr:TRAP transporter large permease subunit [Casimicrobiaceae bacterium]